MNDRLFEIYEQELAVLRKQASEFGEMYPKIAGELRLGATKLEDPQVAMLMESVAFLNSRLRLKLDDEFPEICETYLNILYPHFLAPIPSMSLVHFTNRPDVTLTPEGINVPRHSKLRTSLNRETECVFQTTESIRVWPCNVNDVAFLRPPFPDNIGLSNKSFASILRISLTTPRLPFEEFLNFKPAFHWTGSLGIGQAVVSMILFQCRESWLVASGKRIKIDKDKIGQTCFEKHAGLLPYSERSFDGFRLLTEFFTFPEKFLSFYLDLSENLEIKGNQLDLFFGFDSIPGSNTEKMVNANSFMTGCVPVVNLFEKRLEPINLEENKREYCLFADINNLSTTTIHTVKEARIVSPGGKVSRIPEVFGFQLEETENTGSWTFCRKPAGTGDAGFLDTPQVFMHLVDFEKDFISPGSVLDVKAICSNGLLPTSLPFGSGEPKMTLLDPDPSLANPVLIYPPTRPCHDHLSNRESFRWKLISHLLFNQISLTEGMNATIALKKMIELYNYPNSSANSKIVESLNAINHAHTIYKSPRISNMVLQGSEITLEFKSGVVDFYSILQFSSILDRFLSVYVDACSFSKVQIKYAGENRILHSWPVRLGEKSNI